MIMKSKCYGETRFIAHAMMTPALALTTLLLSGLLSSHPLHAQETVDPRSGRLLLTTTDLMLPAGPTTLEISRTLDPQRTDRGLLGTRWRLNWESRVVPRGPLMLIEETPYPVAFTTTGTAPGYTSVTGDRLIIERDGRMVRTRLDGTRETFDVQGRLVERDYRNGNKVTLRYGPDGRLARLDAPKRTALQFGFDAAGRLIRVEVSTSATVRYAYTNDALTEVQVKGRSPIRYGYDATGALVRIENPRSGAVEIAYDTRGRVLSRRWADGSQERWEYEDTANRQRHVDPTGGISTIQWSQDKRTAEITNPLGHKSVIVSDPAGRPLSVTGPTSATARFTYDPLGRTIAVQNPLGQVIRYEYLAESARVKTIIRPDGTREAYEYDSRGNPTAIKVGSETFVVLAYHPDGSVATVRGVGTPEHKLSYYPDGRLEAVTNLLGGKTRFEYDRRGNPIRETNPLGGVTRYQYDAQDRLVSTTDPVGATTRYAYDTVGRLSQVTDPAGGVTRYGYDLRGRLVAETDPAARATRYEYAVSDRLATIIAPDGTTERFQYDALGNQTGWTDRLGRSTVFAYDPLGRISRERWPTGLEIRYRYDTLGNLVGAEDTTGAKGEFQRDPSGQLTAHVDPLGAVTRYQYDPLGNLLALTDPRGQSKRFAYTPEGRLATAQEPSGDVARYEYDQAGRLVAAQRPSGGVTRFSYDAMGSVTEEVDPLGNRWRHAYDAAGRLVSTTDAAGRTTRYSYDRSGRLMEKLRSDGKRVAYQYDRLDNLMSADDGAFPIRRSYDPAGRLVRDENPAIKKAVGYEYDGSGLRTKLIHPEGRTTRYEFAADKRLAAVILPDGKRISVTYDEKDRLQAIRYPNGVTGRWEYDAGGQVTRITYQDHVGKSVGAWTYRHDAAGNLAEQADQQGRASRFQYDAGGQLTEAATPEGTTRYRYLPGGNRAAVEEGGTLMPYRHDAADRVLQAGQEELTYDANGNLVARKGSAGTTAYEYDTEGRLVKVIGPDGTTTSFGYAPTGERVWRRDRNGLTYFVYDGLDLIGELNETGVPKVTYVHGPGIDEPLAMLRDGRTYYYHADRLGSIRLLTDDQGQVAAAYDYDAFGKLTRSQGSVPNPFTFTGREWDASTGLYYYRARYYDPGLGRFISPDPVRPRLEDPLNLNPYLYAWNNPHRFVDAMGLGPEDVASMAAGMTREQALDFVRKRRALMRDLYAARSTASPGDPLYNPEALRLIKEEYSYVTRLERGLGRMSGNKYREGGASSFAEPEPPPPGPLTRLWEGAKGFFGGGGTGGGGSKTPTIKIETGGAPVKPRNPTGIKMPGGKVGGVLIFLGPAILLWGANVAEASPEDRWAVAKKEGENLVWDLGKGVVISIVDPLHGLTPVIIDVGTTTVDLVDAAATSGAPPPPPILDPTDPFGPGLPIPTPEQIARATGLGGQGGVPEAGGQPGQKGGWNVGPQGPYLAPGGAPPGQLQPGQEVQIPMCRDESGNLVPCGGAPAGKPGQEVQIPLCKDERGNWVPCHLLGRGSGPGRVPSSGPGSTQPGAGGSTSGSPPGATAKAPPAPAQPPAKTPGSGVPDVDLSGTWYATYREPFTGYNFRFTMTLSRVVAGKWQGPLDYVNVDRPDWSFKTQAMLQATGVGKVHLTFNDPRHGPQQADGTYTNSQITFGTSTEHVTYTRK